MKRLVRVDEFLKSGADDRRKKNARVRRMKELSAILARAHLHALNLSYAKAVPCDVCVENFVLEREKALELGGRIFGEIAYSADDMSRELLDELYPDFDAAPSADLGRVRVHGFTRDGKYQTYCHFCDADMCLSQVQEGRDWDRFYELRYGDFISRLPKILGIFRVESTAWDEMIARAEKSGETEERIEAELLQQLAHNVAGSCAWLVAVDLFAPRGILNRDYVLFMHKGRKWIVHVLSGYEEIADKIRQSRER